jgi:hypothetical protein
VNQCYTRHATLPARSTEQNVENLEERVEGGEEDGDMDEEAEDSDDIDDGGEDGDADGLLKERDADGFLKHKRKTHKPRTPIKARLLLPFIHNKMADMPNMSNREMKNLLADYVKAKFLTGLLLQNARKIAWDEIFGDPSNNVFYTRGLVAKMEEAGHGVLLVLKDCIEVMKMLERVIVSDEMRKNKAIGKLMTKQQKIGYVTKWKATNKGLLKEGGLLVPAHGTMTTPLTFVSGICFSVNGAWNVVPHLQRVFQANACHMNFGKYTLYLCYGTTANCNTFPVAIFGDV